MRQNSISICDFMDSDKGEKDCTSAFLRALEHGGAKVFVPCGEYFVSKTVEIPENTHLVFDRAAKVSAKAGFCGPLFKNRTDCGNITLSGGFFAAGTDGKEDSVVFCFDKTQNITVSDCTVTNSKGGYIRACDVNGFCFENIRLNRFAKDCGGYGVLVCGESLHGTVSCIKMMSEDTFFGDMVVLQDSCSDIKIHDIAAIGCRAFASVSAKDGHRAQRIIISSIAGGCESLLALDGSFSDITLSDAEVFVCRGTDRPLISITGKADGFIAENICRPGLLDSGADEVCTLCFVAEKTCEALVSGLTRQQAKDTVLFSALSSVAVHSRNGVALDCLMRSSDRFVVCHGGFDKLIIKHYEE